MSVQRRRGQAVSVWPSKRVINSRGGDAGTLIADMAADPYVIKAAVIPLRSSRAEIPGQLEILSYTVIMPADLPGVDLWSRALWRGAYWDISSPPLYHHGGTKSVRHWTMVIRSRPGNG